MNVNNERNLYFAGCHWYRRVQHDITFSGKCQIHLTFRSEESLHHDFEKKETPIHTNMQGSKKCNMLFIIKHNNDKSQWYLFSLLSNVVLTGGVGFGNRPPWPLACLLCSTTNLEAEIAALFVFCFCCCCFLVVDCFNVLWQYESSQQNTVFAYYAYYQTHKFKITNSWPSKNDHDDVSWW